MRRIVPFLLVALMIVPASAADEPGPFTKDHLPEGWSITREIVVPASQLAFFSKKLGGKIVDLRNQDLDVNGFPARANVIRCADEASAKAVEKTMIQLRGEDFVARRGSDVIEIPERNLLLTRRLRAALGIPRYESRSWKVSFRVALVDELVEAERNPVFNLFLGRKEGVPDPALETAIRDKTADWTFRTTLRLLRSEKPQLEVRWTFEPKPKKTEEQEDGTTVYTFEDPPRVLGIPYAEVTGWLVVEPRFAPTPIEGDEGSAQGTATWPVKGVKASATKATKGATTPRARVLALLRYLGGRIRYGGPQGSRDPVHEVLGRGYGRCFDKSDVFVALCRSVGIPARVVAGWVPALGAGHVWTEVRLGEDGWIPVDATTTWLGVSTDYLPFFRTGEGPLPFLYLGMPKVHAVE